LGSLVTATAVLQHLLAQTGRNTNTTLIISAVCWRSAARQERAKMDGGK